MAEAGSSKRGFLPSGAKMVAHPVRGAEVHRVRGSVVHLAAEGATATLPSWALRTFVGPKTERRLGA